MANSKICHHYAVLNVLYILSRGRFRQVYEMGPGGIWAPVSKMMEVCHGSVENEGNDGSRMNRMGYCHTRWFQTCMTLVCTTNLDYHLFNLNIHTRYIIHAHANFTMHYGYHVQHIQQLPLYKAFVCHQRYINLITINVNNIK